MRSLETRVQHAMEAVFADLERGRSVRAARRAQALLRRGVDDRTLPFLGYALSRLQLYAEALSCIERAIVLKPGSVRLRALLADVLIESGQPEKGLVELRQIPESARDAQTWIELGVVQHRLGDSVSSEAAFRRAIDVEPSNDLAMYNLGKSIEDRDPVAARRLYRDAIRIDPQYSAAIAALGRIEVQLGRFSQGSALLVRALAYSTANVQELCDAALHCIHHDAPEQAMELLEACLEHGIDEWDVRAMRGMVFQDTGDLPMAVAEYRCAIEQSPHIPVGYWLLATAYMDLRQFATAIPLLNRALEIEPSFRPAQRALRAATKRSDRSTDSA